MQMHVAGIADSKLQKSDDQSLLHNQLLIVAEKLKSNADLLQSTGEVSWCEIWNFLGFQDELNLDEIKTNMSKEADELKAEYGKLIAEQDWYVQSQTNQNQTNK